MLESIKPFRTLQLIHHASCKPVLPIIRFQRYSTDPLCVVKLNRLFWAVPPSRRNTTTSLLPQLSVLRPTGLLTGRLHGLQPRKALANIHSTTPSNGPYRQGVPPKRKIIKISNGVLLLGMFAFGVVILFALPVMISLLFPLIIVGILFNILRSWKSKEIYRQIHKSLQLSTLKMSSRTWAELQKRNLESIFPGGAPSMEQMFRTRPQGMNMGSFNIKHDQSAVDRANRLLVFMQNRINESFAKNEQGIRSYFLGNRTSETSFEVDTSSPSFSLSRLGDDRVASINYPAYLISEEVRAHVGKVSIVILEDTAAWATKGDFMSFVLGMEQYDNFYPMVIAVRALGPFSSRVFLLSDIGNSNHSNYSVRKTEKGNREFTYHDKSTDI